MHRWLLYWRVILSVIFFVGAKEGSAQEAVSGEPWRRHAIDNTSEGADGVKLADVNGDHLPDIVTGWEEGGVIRRYLHPGIAQVAQPWPLATVGSVASPEDAVYADLDGDGAVDVVSATEGQDRCIYVHWAPEGSEQPWKTAPLVPSRGKQWMFLAPVQLDGKNGVDLLAGAKNDGAQLGWFEAPAAPRYLSAWKWHPLREAGWIMSISLRDMDGDGDQDVLYSDRRGTERGVWWLEYPGTHRVAAPWQRHAMGGRAHEVMFLDCGRLSLNGPDSVVAATLDAGLLVLTPGIEGAWAERQIAMPENTGTGKGVGVGDLDDDGLSDIAVSCENAAGKHGVFWLRAQGADGWSARAISGLEGTKFDLIQLVDLDQDGDLDLLTCEERENLGVIWYENPSR